MNETAPEGQVWVCAACGKQSRDRYGYGWDESCMLHAVLCFEQKNENGSWQAVPTDSTEEKP